MRTVSPAGVLQASALAGVPVAVLCGVASADAPGAVVRSLVDLVGRGRALADAPGSLERLAQELAEEAPGRFEVQG